MNNQLLSKIDELVENGEWALLEAFLEKIGATEWYENEYIQNAPLEF